MRNHYSPGGSSISSASSAAPKFYPGVGAKRDGSAATQGPVQQEIEGPQIGQLVAFHRAVEPVGRNDAGRDPR